MTGLPLPRSTDHLIERLEDACRTLRRVPSARNSRPGEMRVAWPDTLREAVEAYGYQVARGGAVKASAAEIARMDEVLGWIARWWSAAEMARAGLPEDAGAVAWLRAGAGWQMRRLAEWRRQRTGLQHPPGGVSRESLRVLVHAALLHMLGGLHGRPVREEVPAEPPAPVVVAVVVDEQVEQRVVAIRGRDPAQPMFVTQTRHARAEHREVPDPRVRRKD